MIKTLYHGTSSSGWEAIKKAGAIMPRFQTGEASLWDEHPSSPNHVYLTTAYAPYFAMNAAAESEDTAIIIEIDAVGMELFPDEDFLEQMSRKKRPEGCPQDMAGATAFFARHLDAYSPFAEQSVEVLGNCAAHYVSMESITRVIEIPQVSGIVMSWDPSITPMNYALMGEHYRRMSAALFDPDYDAFFDRLPVELRP